MIQNDSINSFQKHLKKWRKVSEFMHEKTWKQNACGWKISLCIYLVISKSECLLRNRLFGEEYQPKGKVLIFSVQEENCEVCARVLMPKVIIAFRSMLRFITSFGCTYFFSNSVEKSIPPKCTHTRLILLIAVPISAQSNPCLY